MPEVSIIMAAKNRLKSTERTLQSYSRLAYKDYELIVVDDGSSDNIKGVCDKFPKLPIKYLRLESGGDRCPAISYNYGYKNSDPASKFLIFCNADTIISASDMIEKFLAQFDGVSRLSVLTYFLSQTASDNLDAVRWMDNPDIIQSGQGFWTIPISGGTNTFRRDNNMAEITTHCTGQSRERWEWFGLFRDDPGHLFSDQDIRVRENALGIRAKTLEGCSGYHQWHPGASVVFSPHEYYYNNELQARLLEPAEDRAKKK